MGSTKSFTEYIFYWLPRVSGVLFIAFLSFFALDVFDGSNSLGAAVVGFLIHLIPSYLVLLAFIYAWKWERSGGFILILLAVAFTLFFNIQETATFMAVVFPVLLTGTLFLLHYYLSRNDVRHL